MNHNTKKKIAEKLSEYAAVVISGASSGIGKATAEAIHECAPEMPICCLSRTRPEANFADCENFLHVAIDLSSSENIDKALPEIFNFLSKYGVEEFDTKNARKNRTESGKGGKTGRRALLINNAGFGLYGEFTSNDADKVGKLIDVNVRALTILCSLLKGRASQIVNISSTAAWQPCPYLAVYAASKSYVMSLSLSLDYEMRKSGAGRCLCICPGPTSSNFFRAAGWKNPPLPSGFGHKAEDVAKVILLALAVGKSLKVVGVINSLQTTLVKFLPIVFLTRISGIVLSKIRKE